MILGIRVVERPFVGLSKRYVVKESVNKEFL